jgi:hypothetical protein
MIKENWRFFRRESFALSIRTVAVIALAAWITAGCAPLSKQPDPIAASAPGPSDQAVELMEQNQILEKALTSRQARIQKLENEIAGLNLKILEYEALVQDMLRRSEVEQTRLDAAIVEVVRAKAKMRSLESKAEAASTLAEAEIAVKALKSRGLPAEDSFAREIAAIDQLLTMGVNEFKSQNYGGALFLANQTKEQVLVVQRRLDRHTESAAVEGESLLLQSLPLKLLKNTNLREGPGLDWKIVVTLDQGTPVVGYAFKGNWIRVETRDGIEGWVYQDLVGAP